MCEFRQEHDESSDGFWHLALWSHVVLYDYKGNEMAKSTVGVRELKARLSAYLKQVTQGRVVEVTSRGKTIARMLPCARKRKSDAMDLVREGVGNWNGKRVRVKMPRFGFKGGKLASDLVVENRE